MNMRKLSINKACILLGTLLLLTVGAVCTAVYLLTQNITAVRCVFLFSLFVLLCVIFFVALIRRKLVRFSDAFCGQMDDMLSGDMQPKQTVEEESLFYKINYRLGRLAKQSGGGDSYEDGALSINFSEMTASLSGKPLVFTPLEYRLLKIMTKNPQNVLTRQVLLEKLWDADGNFVDEHALTAAISRVRNKIETDGRQYIKTVYGMGYMWIGGALK